MGFFNTGVGKALGGTFSPSFAGGMFGGSQSTKPNEDTNQAQTNLDQIKGEYANLKNPETEEMGVHHAGAATAGPSDYNNIQTDPAAKEAQKYQMMALANLAKNGGRNAASDANLAAIQSSENANARGQRDALTSNFAARGMSGGGNELLAKLSAQQGDLDSQSARDTQVAGQQAQTALAAGQGAASIGNGLENQNFGEAATRAGANDATSRFNAGQVQQNNEFNTGADIGRDQYNNGLKQQRFTNDFNIAQGKAGADKTGADYWGGKYKEDQATNGGIMSGIMGMMTGGATAMAKSGAPAAAAAAHGGKVPGNPAVHGDSMMNDSVPVHTSPGEVIVPRSVVHSNDPSKIADFVKNPPPIQETNDRDLKLAVLKGMSRKRHASRTV